MHGAHHAGARPIGGHIVAGLIRIVAHEAIAAQISVDQALVEWRQIFISDSKLANQRLLVVGYENIRAGYQSQERLASAGIGQIQRHAFFVPALQNPAILER